MKFFFYPLCPRSIRVLILLSSDPTIGPYEKEEVLFKQSLLKLSEGCPTNVLPIIKTEQLKLFSDLAIIEFLRERNNPYVKINPHIQTMESYLTEFYFAVYKTTAYEKTLKVLYEDSMVDMKKVQEGLKQQHHFLNFFNELLLNQPWIQPESFSLNDITLFSIIACLDYVGQVPWFQYKFLKSWYSRMKSKPEFFPVLSLRIPNYIPSISFTTIDF